MSDVTRRFSDRVANYVRYRPDYPVSLLDALTERGVLRPDATWADVGAGTGIWTRQLAGRVAAVWLVEPNREMRAAGEAGLADLANVNVRDGKAEATGLPAGSCDGITAAQAFHWFDRGAFREECRRVLRPGGVVLLVWNERLVSGDGFLADYESLLRGYATDYAQVDHRNVTPAVLAEFFGAAGHASVEHDHAQFFDYEGLEGRLLSSSYAPAAGHPQHAPMLEALRRVFDRHAAGGRVAFRYVTRAYWGTVA